MSEYPKSSAVSACIWSLTTVIKDLLDDPCLRSSESLKKLLPSLDAVFEGFYRSILSPYSSSKDQSASLNPEREAHLSVFLDLLEILVASRLALKSHFACQRVFFLYTSHALILLSSSVHYYIVKKLVLLLKKVMLWTAGDDFAHVPVAASPFVQDQYLKADRLLLCDDILQVVNVGQLQHIPVSDKASYFGGTDICPEDARQTGPDLVQLGALSLIFIKALETKVKMESSDKRLMQGEFESFMSQLLEFLKSHLHSQHVHSCEWVSLVFIEQDDDMLEAAKSLLNLYVKSDRIWPRSINTPDNGKVFPNWTHDAGCNPHCIFLYLLKNVGFDATVLLDFLISTETCFLEYIVRYLKFLREDWTEFCQVCNFIDTFTSKDCATVCEVVTSFQQDCVRSQVDMGVSDGINSTEKAHFFSTDCSFQMPRTSVVAQQTLPCKSSSSTRTDHFCGLGTPRGLVDYDSSDDSEQDTASDPQQNCIRHQSSAGICNDLGAELDRLDLRSTSVNPKGSSRTSAHEDVADTTLESTMLKFTQCLAELQEAISRLKRRNLFPYNPSALLKLLMHIETLQGSKNPL
ncbi:protein Lines homolog 1 isoform X2 [Pleurodeles waltl]